MIQKKFLMKSGTSLKNCTPLRKWTQVVRSSVIFFNVDFQLPEEMASTCEGEITLAECTKALSMMQNNKSPGSDGLTTEFYRAFWDIISTYVVNSFNYAFNTGNLSISQRQGIISLIPKKKKDTQYLLLNVDYKIATKTIGLRIEKVLPHLINPSQTGYVKGRFIGESIRLILDIMEYTKHKDTPGVAVYLDFEKAFDSVEWTTLKNAWKQLTLALISASGFMFLIIISTVAF